MLLNDYLREEFGEKVYKISFDIGAGCPNRDGKFSFGGCAFCSEKASGDFAENLTIDNFDQCVERAIERIRSKTDCNKFISYFQSHTNTYFTPDFRRDSFERLCERFAQRDDIAAISVGTRADCVDDETVAFLRKINTYKPVWVEIGLQTIHDDIRDRMNCCFTLADFEETYKKLEAAGLKTVVHVILGLPGETISMMDETADYLSSLKPFGIKIQMLHVLEGTALSKIYEEEKFPILSMEEYADEVVKFIRKMPRDVVIHRMTGDGDRELLIEPLWSTDKKKVLNMINRKLRDV